MIFNRTYVQSCAGDSAHENPLESEEFAGLGRSVSYLDDDFFPPPAAENLEPLNATSVNLDRIEDFSPSPAAEIYSEGYDWERESRTSEVECSKAEEDYDTSDWHTMAFDGFNRSLADI